LNDIKTKESIISNILNYLHENYRDIIISAFGIGSFFDKSLPTEWNITDIDVIVIVHSLDKIPKLEWTEVRYETKLIEDYKVWLGFNTLFALKNKETFNQESFANYEWSLLDLKCKENSQILYGKDIRNQLPKISELKYDFDDIFLRSLYHLDKSLKESKFHQKTSNSERDFTKSVFKLGFYLCKYFDKSYYLTSVLNISNHIGNLRLDSKIRKTMLHYMNESYLFRRTNKFSIDFKTLRKNFIFFIISLLRSGVLHKKLEFQDIIDYLGKKFNGLPYLTAYIKTAKKIYDFSKFQEK
jgi:hypothetical protein